MLAYELFLKNKESEESVLGSPLKKIFVRYSVDRSIVSIDEKTLDEYGKKFQSETKNFQEAISMPLENQKNVGLPDKTTGANSNQPYVKLYGILNKDKIEISISGKTINEEKEKRKPSFSCTFNLLAGNKKEKNNGPVILRLDDSKYFLGNVSLVQAYRNDGIVDEKNGLKYEVFKKVTEEFLEYCKRRQLVDKLSNFKKRISFRLIVLPYTIIELGNINVEYRSGQVSHSEAIDIDSFGNPFDNYPSVTTKNAKFLSYDDAAFAINCKDGSQFYSNIGIGNRSLEKINFPQKILISGLTWYFFSTTDPTIEFEKGNGGIYEQLHSIHHVLKVKKSPTIYEKPNVIIVCVKEKSGSKKMEIILDENLTIDQLGEALEFKDLAIYTPHPMALESLIQKNDRGEVVVWSDYILAVRSLITAVPVGRNWLLNKFNQIMMKDLFRSWLPEKFKGIDKTEGFFEKSSFCLKILTEEGKKGDFMNNDEEYAYRIGKIVGEYLKYKQKMKESTGSTKDILTYTRYDREKLRFVFSKVGLGISLSKSSDAEQANLTKKIQENTPKEEISDSNAENDYSYFFYKGFFESS